MGFAVAIGSVIVGLIGLGIASAGIYYTASDWGSSNAGEKARVYSLLIAGIVILAIVIGLMAYYMFRPSSNLKKLKVK